MLDDVVRLENNLNLSPCLRFFFLLSVAVQGAKRKKGSPYRWRNLSTVALDYAMSTHSFQGVVEGSRYDVVGMEALVRGGQVGLK